MEKKEKNKYPYGRGSVPKYDDKSYAMLKWRNGYRLSKEDRQVLGLK